MKHLKIVFLLFLFISVLLISNSAIAVDPNQVLNNLPKKWEGTFTWHDTSRPVQKITITITDVSIDSAGNIIALCDGIYYKEHEVQFNAKWSINPESLRFEMWESEPKPSTSIVTDGSHIGKISSGLDKIEAVWTTISSGEKGDLFLQPK